MALAIVVIVSTTVQPAWAKGPCFDVFVGCISCDTSIDKRLLYPNEGGVDVLNAILIAEGVDVENKLSIVTGKVLGIRRGENAVKDCQTIVDHWNAYSNIDADSFSCAGKRDTDTIIHAHDCASLKPVLETTIKLYERVIEEISDNVGRVIVGGVNTGQFASALLSDEKGRTTLNGILGYPGLALYGGDLNGMKPLRVSSITYTCSDIITDLIRKCPPTVDGPSLYCGSNRNIKSYSTSAQFQQCIQDYALSGSFTTTTTITATTTTITTATTTTITYTCPDGSAGLTRALYEAGPAAYANASCVPKDGFKGYAKDVTLTGSSFLKSFEQSAFHHMTGTLTLSGTYPLLESIGQWAFNGVLSVGSSISFVGLPSLAEVGMAAFAYFKGILTFTGSFPSLTSILDDAFVNADNAESNVAIGCSLPPLGIATYAFIGFIGPHDATREQTACSTSTFTTSTITITVATTTTSSTTSTTSTAATTTTKLATAQMATTNTAAASVSVVMSATTTTTTTTATKTTITTMTSTTITVAASPSTSNAVVTNVVIVIVVLLLLVAAFALWWFNCRSQNDTVEGEAHVIPGTVAMQMAAVVTNRMYNIDGTNNDVDEGAGVGGMLPPSVQLAPNVIYRGAGEGGGGDARGRASTVYAIPMEDDGSGGTSSGGSADDVPYGGVVYVSALNQDAPEYATAVEAGSADALYSVVSLNGPGSGGGGENHYDMSAPGEKSRGKRARQKQQHQHQHQQQQQAPAMVYDVAQHVGGGGAAAQLAEYSHLAPRNDGGESNNFYDLGPQQHNGQHGVAGSGCADGGASGQAMYGETDSSV